MAYEVNNLRFILMYSQHLSLGILVALVASFLNVGNFEKPSRTSFLIHLKIMTIKKEIFKKNLHQDLRSFNKKNIKRFNLTLS